MRCPTNTFSFLHFSFRKRGVRPFSHSRKQGVRQTLSHFFTFLIQEMRCLTNTFSYFHFPPCFISHSGNEVSDEHLTRAFGKFPSFQKAKVVRDKRTSKSRGFGFVSFKDPQVKKRIFFIELYSTLLPSDITPFDDAPPPSYITPPSSDNAPPFYVTLTQLISSNATPLSGTTSVVTLSYVDISLH